MNLNLTQRTIQNQSAEDERLCTAIRAVPLGELAWGPKVLLEQLVKLAGKNGEPLNHVATTQPQLADAIGCTHVTAGEFLDVLVRRGLVKIVRRLFRHEHDKRAPNLEDGGSILRVERLEVIKLAMLNRGPTGTRYRPVSEPALRQAQDRIRELGEELATLREGQSAISAKLDALVARLERAETQRAAAQVVEPPQTASKRLLGVRGRRGGGGSGGQAGSGGGGVLGGPGGAPPTSSALGVLADEAHVLARAPKGQSSVQCIPQRAHFQCPPLAPANEIVTRRKAA